jgi:hypothetical protein
MWELALKLILAHLIGDFVLQPKKWVEDKEAKNFKSKFLIFHVLVHALLLLLLLQFNFYYLTGILVIVFSHYFIDVIKSYLNNKISSGILFFADQFLHFMVIGWVVYYYEHFDIHLNHFYRIDILAFATAIIALTYVSSIVISVLLSPWSLQDKSPNNAGKYIGIIERLFVFFFILFNCWEGIGFLLAAKSVFRFGDLRNSHDRNLTEYILIGTLLSFGLAIAVGVLYQYFIKLI